MGALLISSLGSRELPRCVIMVANAKLYPAVPMSQRKSGHSGKEPNRSLFDFDGFDCALELCRLPDITRCVGMISAYYVFDLVTVAG